MKYYKLHLIRHGLTQGNLDGRYIGSGTDLPLCAEGRAQLEELKAKFQYPDVPLVFCSPMLRAQQTAEVLFPNAKLTILQDLREMNFGKFENRPITELVKDPEFAQWMDPTSRTNPDGAEDRKAFYDRTNVMLMKLFEYQLRTHTEEAACITHGGVIMNMMANHVLPQHKQVGIADLRPDKGIGQVARRADVVPVLFARMPRRRDVGILLAQGNRLVGIALHGDPPEIVHIRAGVHLPADLVDQRRLVERRRFLREGQRQAVVAKSQDIHSKLIFG